MVRKLKFHEKKLLKKVDFISWEVDNNLHEVEVMRRYHVQKRGDYNKYKKLSRWLRELSRKIKDLDPKEPFRVESTLMLLDKLRWIHEEAGTMTTVQHFNEPNKVLLYNMGVIPTKANLELCDKVNASSFCRRRLPVVMVKLHMAQTVKMATQFVEQGHVRVGPEVVMDPAFLVTRSVEDLITWVDSSAIKKRVMEYNDLRDDFEM